MTQNQFTLPAGLGPHEERELELLLAGTKPLARISSEPTMGFFQDLTPYQPYVDNGTLINVNITKAGGLIIDHYFCLPTEEWRIKVMEVMEEVMRRPDRGGFTTDDLHRIDGHLLGYSKQDIETFIAHSNRIDRS